MSGTEIVQDTYATILTSSKHNKGNTNEVGKEKCGLRKLKARESERACSDTSRRAAKSWIPLKT